MKNLVLIALLFLSACSGKGLIIHDEPIVPFKYLGNLNVQTVGNPSMRLMEIVDNRPVKNAIGEAATGLANQRSAVTTEGAVSDFVHARISKALQARGFQLNEAAKFGWKIRMQKLWVSEDTSRFGNEKTRCELEFQFDLIELKSNKPRYQGNITSEVEGTNSVLDATSSNGPALESCLLVAVNKFVNNFEVQNLVGYKTK